jgi:hypothetical protein
LESVIGALKGYKKKKKKKKREKKTHRGVDDLLYLKFPSIKATYYKPLSPLEHFLLSAF